MVFEGPEELLDWGARSFRQGVNAVLVPLGPKVAKLLDEYLPELVLLEQPGTRTLEQIVEIQKQAEIHKVPVRLLSPRVVHEAFAGRDDNKHQIASVIAERFSELLSILPPKRKPWQSEDYRMTIFDAAARGIAYFTSGAANDRVLSGPT